MLNQQNRFNYRLYSRSTHHQFIIKGLESGCDVLTEKPLTTDETKGQAILNAERKSDKKLIVGFNYR